MKATFGALTVAGSGIATWFSGGTLTAPMAITAGFGANSVASGIGDIINATFGDFDKVGEFNPIKNTVEFVTEKGISQVTNNEQTISNWKIGSGIAVDVVDIAVSAKGVAEGFDKIFNKSSKLITVATNTMSKVKNAFGNATFKVPEVSNTAKAVAAADVMYNVNSMYQNAKDKVKEFFGEIF